MDYLEVNKIHIISPRPHFLLIMNSIFFSYRAVNVFVALTQCTQLYRAFMHQQGLKNQPQPISEQITATTERSSAAAAKK